MGNYDVARPTFDRTVLYANLGAGLLLAVLLVVIGAWPLLPFALVEVLIGSWALAGAYRDGRRLVKVAVALWGLAVALWYVVFWPISAITDTGLGLWLWTLYPAACFGTITFGLWQMVAAILRVPIRAVRKESQTWTQRTGEVG